VYLHELDCKVAEIRERLEKGRKKRNNPLHRKLSAQRQRLRKRGQTGTKEFRALVRQIRSIPAVDVNDPEFIRVKYIRYADLCRRRHKSAYADCRVMPTPVGKRLLDPLASGARSA
jgi:hypothetical protein